MATLFSAISGDGTHGLMLALSDKSDSAEGYWIGFHLVFTCFFLNLFLGVLTASFEKSSGMSIMTIGEKQWLGFRRMLQVFQPGQVNCLNG
jgi:hypothetical protein